MKRFILSIILGIGILLSFNSCVTTAYASEVGDADVSVVIRYGTPYYYEGSLLYYVYNGWYYYPYVVNNHHYYHRYSRPLPPPRHHHSAAPMRFHRNGNMGHRPPHRNPGGFNHRPPQIPHNGGGMHHRPSQGSHSHGAIKFGGRR